MTRDEFNREYDSLSDVDRERFHCGRMPEAWEHDYRFDVLRQHFYDPNNPPTPWWRVCMGIMIGLFVAGLFLG